MKKQTFLESLQDLWQKFYKKNFQGMGEKIDRLLKPIGQKIKDFYQTHKKLSIVITTMLILAIAGSLFFIARNSKTTADATTLNITVRKGDITETVDIVGSIQAIPSTILAWKTSGIVGEVNLKVGDQVKEGDGLLTLLDISLDSSILNAESELLTAQLELEHLKSGNLQFQTATQALAAAQKVYQSELVDREWWIITGVSDEAIDAARVKYYDSRTAFWNAKMAYEEISKNTTTTTNESNLATTENTSTTAIAVTEDPVAAARATMQALEQEYNKAIRNLNYLIGNSYGNNNAIEQAFLEFDVAKAELAEAVATWQAYHDAKPYIAAGEAKVQAIQNTINSAKIIAPFSGTVTEVDAYVGETVSSGTTAIQLDDLTNLVITVDVSEVDINKLEIGQEAEITFDAISANTYKGAVVNISNAGTSSSGVVRFPVTVQVLNPDEDVKPGFTATVSIIITRVSNVLLVPNLGITKLNGQSIVMVNKNNSIVPVAIETGAESDEYTEVLSGDISEGDVVVVTITSSDASSMMAGGLFRIMGGGGMGGGEPPQRPDNTSNQQTQ